MDINKRKSQENGIGVGGGAEGGALTLAPLAINTDPYRKRSLAPLAGRDTTLQPPAGGRKIFSLSGNSSANERQSQFGQ